MTKFSFWVNWPFKSLHFPAVCNVFWVHSPISGEFYILCGKLPSVWAACLQVSDRNLRNVTLRFTRLSRVCSLSATTSQCLVSWPKPKQATVPLSFSETHRAFTPVTVCFEDRTSHRGFPKGFGSIHWIFFPFLLKLSLNSTLCNSGPLPSTK